MVCPQILLRLVVGTKLQTESGINPGDYKRKLFFHDPSRSGQRSGATSAVGVSRCHRFVFCNLKLIFVDNGFCLCPSSLVSLSIALDFGAKAQTTTKTFEPVSSSVGLFSKQIGNLASSLPFVFVLEMFLLVSRGARRHHATPNTATMISACVRTVQPETRLDQMTRAYIQPTSRRVWSRMSPLPQHNHLVFTWFDSSDVRPSNKLHR